MRRAPYRLLPVSLLLTALACAPSVLLTKATPSEHLADLRAEYRAMNPDGAYCDNVERGEIVRGMDVFGVIASWGTPDRRLRDASAVERWVYVDADQNSGDSIEYALTFRDGMLNGWKMRRQASGDTAVRNPLASAETTPAPAPTGKKVPSD